MRRWTWLVATLGLLGLACCASLPTLTPELSRRSPRSAPQVSTAHGPLTASQSAAVLRRLSQQGQTTSIFDRHLALEDLEEAINASPLSAGNAVRLLQDGPAT